MHTQTEEENIQTLCIHHNDADGRASAAIVRRALGPDVWLCEANYGDPIPLERVLVSDHIVIVDFSLPKDEMEKLATHHQLTWIDHHKTSLDEMTGVADEWPGIRDPDKAACVLTWNYFFPNLPVPQAIRLIGDRDIWRWAEVDTGPFGEGLYQLDTRPLNDHLWNALLNDDKTFVQGIIEDGKILRDARLRDIQRMTRRRGFEAFFEGYRTLVINTRGSGDFGQQVRDLGYQLAYCYVDNLHQGELTTFVSLYSQEADVAKIAEKFGGGGHAGAAGFHFKRGSSPFPEGSEVKIYRHDE